jgi:DNA-binding NarL/FixJ family response regulator
LPAGVVTYIESRRNRRATPRTEVRPLTASVRSEWRLLPCGCDCADPAHQVRITPRRARLLSLIAGGYSNGEIGEALGITTLTAKREVEDLRVASGCRSKRELARWWANHRAEYERSASDRHDALPVL